MAITQEHVEYVAHLSRLTLSDDEKDLFARQLGNILESVDKLNELDTDEVEPLVHMGPETSVMREDSITPSLESDSALANAPDRDRDSFRVPRIID